MLKNANYWAEKNSNKYPEELHKTIIDSGIFEVIECPCPATCECKKWGCNFHITRKKNITFNDALDYFMRCYVDKKRHIVVKQAIESNAPIKGRAAKLIPVTKKIEEKWEIITSEINQKTMLCDHGEEPWIGTEFKVNADTIYHSKWQAFLNPDLFIAYDTSSQMLLHRDYPNSVKYCELIKNIRIDLINFLNYQNQTITAFRKYDDPTIFFKKIKSTNTPLGTIIDKLYLTL
ncbi:hypothetical protein KFZ76_21295 [Methylovulum psychrotolerans]|uniref:hypothetical protein n=1 Tax=Methylovulum psychrotolerans TaxID=1704499 RepID=UPI001BFF0B68|nr:hypothetical protein [Methylovulum psychrotolerans]MBT9100239.1 hypothetical protein [Methylovulum psychrotolerans]